MNTETGELVRIKTDDGKAALLKSEGKLALVPKRFAQEAEAMIERNVVPSPAFVGWASGKRLAAKRRRKIAKASRQRNRRS